MMFQLMRKRRSKGSKGMLKWTLKFLRESTSA